jgi:hypothetical protein
MMDPLAPLPLLIVVLFLLDVVGSVGVMRARMRFPTRLVAVTLTLTLLTGLLMIVIMIMVLVTFGQRARMVVSGLEEVSFRVWGLVENDRTPGHMIMIMRRPVRMRMVWRE